MPSNGLLCQTPVSLADAKESLKSKVWSQYDIELLERLQDIKDELQKVIDERRLQSESEHTKATCDHKDAMYFSRYFESERWHEVWYCKQCDSRIHKEAEEL